MSDIELCERCGHEHRLTCVDLACQMITIEDRMDDLNLRNEKFYAEMKIYSDDMKSKIKCLQDLVLKKNTNLPWWRKLLKNC